MHAQDACTPVVPGRLELPTSTLSVWRSDQLSYGTLLPPNQGRCGSTASAAFLLYGFYMRRKKKQRSYTARDSGRSRKEVFQPHLPVRLPCYDLAPVTGLTLGRPLRLRTSGTPGSHGLTGGVYKARERIHRAMADARLLANPASFTESGCRLRSELRGDFGIGARSPGGGPLYPPL